MSNRDFGGPRFSVLAIGLVFLVAGCSSAGNQGSLATGATPDTAVPADVVAAEPMMEAPQELEVSAGVFDGGKMWTFEYAPMEYFAETYGFEPDEEWFAAARLATLRLPNCTASFVSPNGLMLTNHHCGRGAVARVTREGESLIDDGFYAASLEEERHVPDLYVDQLVAIEDVTDALQPALDAAATPEARAAAREAVQADVLSRHGGDESGLFVQLITLWDGARYSAYVFKRYTDLRLVMTPELQIGAFGGDPDNFTYPRYSMDMNVFRVYDDDGNPLQTDHFFQWSEEGVEEGDAIFVIGNPGSTYRLETVAQLEFRREVRTRVIVDWLNSRLGSIQEYYEAHRGEPAADAMRNMMFGLANTQKLYIGRLTALRDPVIMAMKRDGERQFREAVMADATLAGQYGNLFDEMQEVQDARMVWGPEYGAFMGLTSGAASSATMRRAVLAYQILNTDATDSERMDNLRGAFARVGDQPMVLQSDFLTMRLNDFVNNLGWDCYEVGTIMAGRSPEVTAQAILDQSAMVNRDDAMAALENGLSMDDPAINMVSVFWPRFERYQNEFGALGERQAEIARQLGPARFHVYGTSIPPDATFSLRIADGFIEGYDYNGTRAPVYTTFYGMYDRYYSFGPEGDWALPDRWVNPPPTFDMSAQATWVGTADITGGNSGSPAINTDLEIVGLVFDGNIESLSGDFIFLPEANRTVAVDVRGMLEMLDEIYDADRIVLELLTGQMAETEAEADAVMSNR